ncbi:LysR family transcriptional regulator [Paenibacillus thalictri]|uniref:LysR family transcriptional regulator n=1 Tax=Paenibacillus thalictri TaxID=2527873 RepID=A0A4V2J2Y1_9BACL|nr:LysR family transcriptional regulator [Paenibacillus thalictri]TBL67920.1 LysR family transcriptional regulator [Paenibacillus thalictri]
MDVNLELYRVFYTISISGSFSKAAEKLYITQPAVSHAIKQLEEKLDVKLFFRTSKGVALTQEGEVLFQYIEQAFNFVKAAESKIGEMHNLESGEIRIGASDTLCRYYLLPYLETFHRDYPQIKLHVTNRTSPETIRLLQDGKIDFGLVNMPVDAPVQVRAGMQVHDIMIAGAKYADLNGRILAFEALASYPLILLEEGSTTRRYFDQYARDSGLQFTPEIELGSLDLLVQLAKIGLGLACVTREFVQDELTRGDVFEVQLQKPIPPRQIGLVTLRDMPLSVAARRMVQRLGFAET